MDVRKNPVGMVAIRVSHCLRLTAGLLHMHIAYLLGVLGSELSSFDYQSEAEMVHRRSLCIAIQVLGENHHQLAPSLDWLAFSLLRQGNHKECVLLCYTSMLVTVMHVGVWHPDTANCYANLAAVLEKMGLRIYADKLRAAGQTAFYFAELPSMLPYWQEYYSAIGILPCQNQSPHCSRSGIRFPASDTVTMKNSNTFFESSSTIHGFNSIIARDAPDRAANLRHAQRAASLGSVDLRMLPGLCHSSSVKNIGPPQASLIESACESEIIGRLVPQNLLVGQKYSPGSYNSEKDFTIGVGRSDSKVQEINREDV